MVKVYVITVNKYMLMKGTEGFIYKPKLIIVRQQPSNATGHKLV